MSQKLLQFCTKQIKTKVIIASYETSSGKKIQEQKSGKVFLFKIFLKIFLLNLFFFRNNETFEYNSIKQ